MKLTPEFAESVKLPPIFMPHKRHVAVMDMLDDPEIVGNYVIQVNGWEFEHPSGNSKEMQRVKVRSFPVLGREVLKKVSEALAEAEQNKSNQQEGEES